MPFTLPYRCIWCCTCDSHHKQLVLSKKGGQLWPPVLTLRTHPHTQRPCMYFDLSASWLLTSTRVYMHVCQRRCLNIHVCPVDLYFMGFIRQCEVTVKVTEVQAYRLVKCFMRKSEQSCISHPRCLQCDAPQQSIQLETVKDRLLWILNRQPPLCYVLYYKTKLYILNF